MTILITGWQKIAKHLVIHVVRIKYWTFIITTIVPFSSSSNDHIDYHHDHYIDHHQFLHRHRMIILTIILSIIIILTYCHQFLHIDYHHNHHIADDQFLYHHHQMIILTISILTSGCKNRADSKNCNNWAKKGFCATHPTWMSAHCQLSCKLCSK